MCPTQQARVSRVLPPSPPPNKLFTTKVKIACRSKFAYLLVRTLSITNSVCNKISHTASCYTVFCFFPFCGCIKKCSIRRQRNAPCTPTMDYDNNTKAVRATNCSSETLLLTEEEATSFDGKIFSCSCGGGEDVWTDFLCAQQPDTWIQFAVTGRGTDTSHALIAVKGVRRLLITRLMLMITI